MQVKQDVFPAFVAMAAAESGLNAWDMTSAPATKHAMVHQIITARVVVTGDRIIIARDGPNGPEVVFNQPYEPGNHHKAPDVRTDSYVITTNGTRVVFRKDSNCGCGSRLRSWSPYGTVNSVKDPTS